MLALPCILAIFGALILVVMLSKITIRGGILISSFLFGICLFSMAPYGLMFICTFVGGIIGEILYDTVGKNNHAGKIIGVVCPMLGLALGEYIPLCYMQDAFKAFYAERITGNMANASMELINTPIVVVLTIVTILCAILGYGRENATQEEIEAAAKLAHCHDFIMALPDGYDTMVGEGGSTLSGGEKQRISIARAILKDAPVLLLDEATSSLDPENEVEVQQAIEELVKDRTVVMIAHKLKTIAGADQIIVLDQGEVKEVGTHKELMDNHGLYRHLWDIQQTTAGWQIN